MRNNEPVTQREFDIPRERDAIVCHGQAQSRFSYANAAFIAVSGFDPQEIIGPPHNIVRHPDMPKEAFADMWATLKVRTVVVRAGKDRAEMATTTVVRAKRDTRASQWPSGRLHVGPNQTDACRSRRRRGAVS
jgi:aerotaxis receptor